MTALVHSSPRECNETGAVLTMVVEVDIDRRVAMVGQLWLKGWDYVGAVLTVSAVDFARIDSLSMCQVSESKEK
jgi:hypothetical protein